MRGNGRTGGNGCGMIGRFDHVDASRALGSLAQTHQRLGAYLNGKRMCRGSHCLGYWQNEVACAGGDFRYVSSLAPISRFQRLETSGAIVNVPIATGYAAVTAWDSSPVEIIRSPPIAVGGPTANAKGGTDC